jgi:OPT oligopeptide transporter protein
LDLFQMFEQFHKPLNLMNNSDLIDTTADSLVLDSNAELIRDKTDYNKIVTAEPSLIHPSLNSDTALSISNDKSNAPLSNSVSFNTASINSVSTNFDTVPDDYQRNDSKLLAKTEKTGKIPRDSNQNDGVDDEWVSSITPTTDDPKMSSFTVRAICMGIIWALFLSISNTLFSFRQNPFRIPLSVVVLLSFPLGRFFQVVIPLNQKVLGIPLNPGPFTIKEHALVSLVLYLPFLPSL